jgi:hypothetical protein
MVGDVRPIEGLAPDDVAHITAYVRQAQCQSGIQLHCKNLHFYDRENI